MKTRNPTVLLLSLLIVIFSISVTYSQDLPPRKNSFYLELGGDAVFISLNYERILVKGSGLQLNGRLGTFPLIVPDFSSVFAVVGLNAILGKPPNYGEVGISFVANNVDDVGNYQSYRIGYRYEGKDNFLFKAAFTFLNPRSIFGHDNKLHRWFGISFGKVF